MVMATIPAWATWSMLALASVLTVFLVFMFTLAVNLIFRKKAQWPPLPAPPLTVPPSPFSYRYEDFIEDLKNPSVSIDTVIWRCGGTIPREWEERISPAPEKAAVGPIASLPEDSDRAQARKDWFNRLAVSTPVIPVVPAPAVPPPVPMIKGWIIHCKWCTDIGPGNYSSGSRRLSDTLPGHHGLKRSINTCQYCGGKGMVMITGG